MPLRKAPQLFAAHALRRVVNIIELELVLREIEAFGLLRDPGKYHLTIYGAPDAAQRREAGRALSPRRFAGDAIGTC